MSDKAAADSRPSNASQVPKAPGVSGKRLTVVTLIALLVTGALFYWVATSYATYNAARRQTDAAWRALAIDLDARYRAFDSGVARGVESGSIDAPAGTSWRNTLDAFSGTSLSVHQIQAARDLEAIIQSLPGELKPSIEQSNELKSHATQYASAAAHQRAVGQSAGSLLIKRMLVLPDPLDFQIAE